MFSNSCIDKSITVSEATILPKTYTLLLPETSGISFGGYYTNLNDSLYIRTVSYPKTAIEVFSIQSGELIRTLPINGSGDLGGVYYDVEEGGFYVFDNYNRKLLLVDNDGNLLKEWDEFERININGVGNFYTNWGFFQIVKKDDKLYFPIDISHGNDVDNKHTDFINMPNLRVFDLKTKSFSSIGKVSPSNSIYDFGLSQRYTFAYGDNCFVISPAYHRNLIKIEYSSRNIEFIDDSLSSGFLEIKPFRTWEEKDRAPFASGLEETTAMMENYRISPLYSGIYFDPYRKLYYRTFIIPRTKERKGEAGVIVYNINLRSQAIYSIPNHYNLNGAFVTEKGLNLINRKEYQVDNSKLIFDAFVLD